MVLGLWRPLPRACARGSVGCGDGVGGGHGSVRRIRAGWGEVGLVLGEVHEVARRCGCRCQIVVGLRGFWTLRAGRVVG